MTSKKELLDTLESEIIRVTANTPLASTATQLVMGQGSVDAEIVFIGEAPGKAEDVSGMPFVGASGKLLDAMLEKAELVRSEVYITNIIKYRPPNNRDPTRAEKQLFWPFLERQIEIIAPKVIIPLGRHSMENFIPNATIGQQHGEPVEVAVGGSRYTVVPLYHPAAALYNGSLRQVLFDDFAKTISLYRSVFKQ